MGLAMRSMMVIVLLLGLVAMAFGAYVAIDEDGRTLVWEKWQQDVPYEWPGSGRNISIEVQVP